MGIFIELQTALLEALNDYENEKAAKNKTIAEKRQADIIRLKALLATSESEEENHAVLLRQRVEAYIEQLDMHPWAKTFPSLFGSELYQKVHCVLDQPDYRESTIMAREHSESYARQKKLLRYLENAEVCDLVKTIEALDEQLKTSQTTCTNLETYCNQLQIENDQLKDRIQQLEAELAESKRQRNNPTTPPAFKPHPTRAHKKANEERGKETTYLSPSIFPKR